MSEGHDYFDDPESPVSRWIEKINASFSDPPTEAKPMTKPEADAYDLGSQTMLAVILRVIDNRAKDQTAPELMRFIATLIGDEVRILYGEPRAERPIGILHAGPVREAHHVDSFLYPDGATIVGPRLPQVSDGGTEVIITASDPAFHDPSYEQGYRDGESSAYASQQHELDEMDCDHMTFACRCRSKIFRMIAASPERETPDE